MSKDEDIYQENYRNSVDKFKSTCEQTSNFEFLILHGRPLVVRPLKSNERNIACEDCYGRSYMKCYEIGQSGESFYHCGFCDIGG